MKDLNVLSLFDGMSCGMIALRRLGLPVGRYFASEIDKYAIQVSQDNWLEIEHIGSVVDVSAHKLPVKIDLLIGGSPCQGFSFAGKQLNFDDHRSKLFFEFVRIWEEVKAINPDAKFLLENVKMKKEHQDVISKYMGVEPITINSALVSAQNRKRLYWTNIEGVTQPKDKGIMLKDIVHEFCIVDRDKSNAITATYQKKTETDYFNKSYGQIVYDFNINPSGKGMNGKVQSVERDKSDCLTTNKGEGPKVSINLSEYLVPFDKTLKILEKEVERGKVGFFRKDSQANRVYYIHDKAVTLCGDAGGGAAKMGQYLFGCITPDRLNKNQNGQRFSEGRKFYTLTAQDQHSILIEGYIRKLTPVECERLQTISDNYSACVSNAQRYKMLGNGWNVDTICHILQNLDPL